MYKKSSKCSIPTAHSKFGITLTNGAEDVKLTVHVQLTQIALMSDSWPVKVCRHIPSLMSQSLAEASQAPDTNILVSGARDRLITSPVWPANVVVCWPVSMSHRALQNNPKRSYIQAATYTDICDALRYSMPCQETKQTATDYDLDGVTQHSYRSVETPSFTLSTQVLFWKLSRETFTQKVVCVVRGLSTFSSTSYCSTGSGGSEVLLFTIVTENLVVDEGFFTQGNISANTTKF